MPLPDAAPPTHPDGHGNRPSIVVPTSPATAPPDDTPSATAEGGGDAASPAVPRQTAPLYSRIKHFFPLTKSRSSASLSTLVGAPFRSNNTASQGSLPMIVTTSPTNPPPSSSPADNSSSAVATPADQERLSTSSADAVQDHQSPSPPSPSTRTSASTHRPTNLSSTHLHVITSANVATAIASTSHIHFQDQTLSPQRSSDDNPQTSSLHKSFSSSRVNEGTFAAAASGDRFIHRIFPTIRKSPKRVRRKNHSASSMEEIAPREYERQLSAASLKDMVMSAPASPKLSPHQSNERSIPEEALTEPTASLQPVERPLTVGSPSTSSEYFPAVQQQRSRGRSSTVSSVNSDGVAPRMTPSRSRRSNTTLFFNVRGRNESGRATPTEKASMESTATADDDDGFHLPAPDQGESAEKYFSRLQGLEGGLSQCIKKLLESSDPLHTSTLEIYLSTIPFDGFPLDMAMRYLLLHLPLPKEQGAIYRLLELFSRRYLTCNPALWDSHDQILVVCYSILMLNTDVWNSNNKTKMTREQYVRNTAGQGASEDILSCWYDNITLTPFIDSTNPLFSRLRTSKAIMTIATVGDRATRAMLDTYIPLIDTPPTTSLDELKIIYSWKGKQFRRIVENSPIYTGTAPSLPVDHVHEDVGAALRVTLLNRARAKSDGFALRGLSVEAGESGRLVKVGVFARRERTSRFGRASQWTWVETGVLLLDSKILFFRGDLSFVEALMVPETECLETDTIIPPLGAETILDLSGILAVYDPSSSQGEQQWIIRLVPVIGETEYLRLTDEETMNTWVAAINYLAALATAIAPPLETETALNMLRRRAGTMAPPAGRPVPLRTVSSTLELRGRSKSEQSPPRQLPPSKLSLYTSYHKELEAKLPLQKIGVDSLLRQARGLLVQTPLQEKTRGIVLNGLERVTKRLKSARIELERTNAYIEVLSRVTSLLTNGGIRLVEKSHTTSSSASSVRGGMDEFQLPALDLHGAGRRGHTRKNTSEGTLNTMLSSQTLYGALMGDEEVGMSIGVPVRRIAVASPTASVSPTSERGRTTPATPRSPMSHRSRSHSPGLMSEKDREWEKEESASEKEDLGEIKTQGPRPIENIPTQEKEFGMSEKRALLDEVGHEGIKKVARVVWE